jgi:hypothetical protein
MFIDAEKEEFKRIVNRFVERRRCFRPIHPEQVLQELKRFKEVEDGEEEEAPIEVRPRFQL